MNTEDLSSLFFAVRCGEVETVKELLKVKGHSTVASTSSSDSSSGIARLNYSDGNSASHSVSANISDGKGLPLLYWAARYGQKDMVKYLIEEAGADIFGSLSKRWRAVLFSPTEPLDNENTVLSMTAFSSSNATFHYLLITALPKALADLRAKLTATTEPQTLLTVEQALTKFINAKDLRGATILQTISGQYFATMPTLHLLFRLGADPDLADPSYFSSQTPLRIATEHQTGIKKCILFLQHGASTNAVMTQSESGLLHGAIVRSSGDQAARESALAYIRLLVDNGADIEQQDCEGNTPLYFSVVKEHTEAVTLFLREGANVNAPNREGLTAVDHIKKSEMTLPKELVRAVTRAF